MALLSWLVKGIKLPYLMIKEFITGKSVYKTLFRFYFLMIVSGALLLLLPFANQMNRFDLNPLDALFTAASAFSDTGLTIVVTSEYFSFFGQLVILLLIQVGGIGFMAIRVFFFILMNQKIGIRQRALIGAERGIGQAGGTIKLIKVALKVVLYGELVVAILMGLRFYFGYFNDPNYPFQGNYLTLIWHSIFHSVSAFNNAGFDITGAQSLVPYASDYFIQFLVMGSLIIGGIGFPVFYDISEYFKAKKKEERFHWSLFTQVSTQVYLWVFIVGLLLVTVVELSSGTMLYSDIPLMEKVFYLIFHTASTRNAGYATIDLNQLNIGTQLIFAVMMWIGASPSSTGGGIRTTTFWIAVSTIFAFARGEEDVNIKNRQIPLQTVRQSLLIIFLTIMLVFSATLVIVVSTPQVTFFESFFETMSAFGTTGLSLGITSQLSPLGKIAIIFLMVIGQVGVSSSLLIWKDRKLTSSSVKLPKEDMVIG